MVSHLKERHQLIIVSAHMMTADLGQAHAAPASSCIKPHVLMLPFPLQGHITPLMQLSKLLSARGFTITFATTEFNVGKILQAKQGLMGSDLSKLGIKLAGIPDRPADIPLYDLTGDPQALLASLLFLHTSFDELVRTMVQEQGIYITCIISDSFLLWSQDVADKWHIPRVSFWPQSLTAFACSINLPKIRAAYPDLDPFKEEVYRSDAWRVLHCIPGVRDIAFSKLPFFTLGGEDTAKWLNDHVQVQIDRVNEPLCIICNTFPDLEGEVLPHLQPPILSKPIFTLGPLLPSTFLGGQDGMIDHGTGSSLYDEDEECMQWLDGQRPHSVLYISLGSLASLHEKDVSEIAMGLEACNVPSLWVIRSCTHESTSALQKTQSKVVQWAPQLRVLSHEAVGGFLTHCGWNSTLESISLGVPVIGWPQMMDQNTNCWFQVEKLKVGLQLQSNTSCEIQNAIRTLMQEEEGHRMRMRASHLSLLAQSAVTASRASNLDSLVQTILTTHKTLSLPQSQ